MTAYYNEHDEFAADWLRNLIKAGLIADGEVDTRSIVDVRPSDLRGFTQCHFFAGIGGWSYALRKAGWDDNCPAWTGSCPCQPFSLAGAQRGFADERHLWPVWREIIRKCGPAIVFGEQVASATEWLGLVRGDLEEMGYAVGAMPVQAASAGADHLRDRYWFVADADDAGSQGRRILSERAGERAARADGLADTHELGACEERQQRSREFCGAGCDPESCDCSDVADRNGDRTDSRRRDFCEVLEAPERPRGAEYGAALSRGDSPWGDRDEGGDLEWVIGADGKARRVIANLRGVVDGLPESLGGLCSDCFAEAAQEVIEYAKATERRPGEVLRAVRDTVAAEAVWQKPRGFFGIQEAEVLLPFLCELEKRFDQGRIPGSIQEASRTSVRGVRLSTLSARPSQGRGLHEQHPVERPDALHALSQFLACAAGQALEALRGNAGVIPLLEHGVKNRVGLLRGFGNAIDPRPAAAFIKAYMSAAMSRSPQENASE